MLIFSLWGFAPDPNWSLSLDPAGEYSSSTPFWPPANSISQIAIATDRAYVRRRA